MNKEGDLTEESWEGVEGNTLKHMMYIHKLIRLNHYAEQEKEGGGRE